jgi:transposase-like protein
MTKTKGAFPNGMALLKLVYLATKNIEKIDKPITKLKFDRPTIIY